MHCIFFRMVQSKSSRQIEDPFLMPFDYRICDLRKKINEEIVLMIITNDNAREKFPSSLDSNDWYDRLLVRHNDELQNVQGPQHRQANDEQQEIPAQVYL